MNLQSFYIWPMLVQKAHFHWPIGSLTNQEQIQTLSLYCRTQFTEQNSNHASKSPREAEAGKALWLQDQSGLYSEFQDNQGNIERPCLKKKQSKQNTPTTNHCHHLHQISCTYYKILSRWGLLTTDILSWEIRQVIGLSPKIPAAPPSQPWNSNPISHSLGGSGLSWVSRLSEVDWGGLHLCCYGKAANQAIGRLSMYLAGVTHAL